VGGIRSAILEEPESFCTKVTLYDNESESSIRVIVPYALTSAPSFKIEEYSNEEVDDTLKNKAEIVT
jgi:flagellar assembly factor FliW